MISLRVHRLTAVVACVCAPAVSLDVAAAEEGNRDVEDTIVVRGAIVRTDALSTDREDTLLRQPDHLSDLIGDLPGVEVAGQDSTVTRINLRGLDNRDLALVLDGSPQTNYLYHHVGSVLVDPAVLSTVDVRLGNTDVLFGGLGGSIVLKTIDGADLLTDEQKFGGRAAFRASNNRFIGGDISLAVRLAEQVDVLVHGGIIERDDFKTPSGDERLGTRGRGETFLGKVGWTIAEGHRVELAYDMVEEDGDKAPRPDLSPEGNALFFGDTLFPTVFSRDDARFTYEGGVGPAQISASAYLQNSELTVDERALAGSPFSLGVLRAVDGDRTGGLFRTDTPFEFIIPHRIEAGFEWTKTELKYRPGDVAAVVSASRTAAFYLQDTLSITDKFDLRGGLRYTDHKVEYPATGDRSFDETTASFGASWRPISQLELFASTTSLFKGPETSDPFSGIAAVKIIADDLEPETGRNTEIGSRISYDWRGTSGQLFVRWFKTDIDNVIADVVLAQPGGGTVARDTNIGDLTIEGLETTLSFDRDNLHALLTFATADFEANNLNPNVNSVDVIYSLRELGDSFSYEIGYRYEPFNIEISARGEVVAEKSTFNNELKEGYDVHNLSVLWQPEFSDERFTIVAGIDNIFDETYSSHAGRTGEVTFPGFGVVPLGDVAPGRAFKLSIEARF